MRAQLITTITLAAALALAACSDSGNPADPDGGGGKQDGKVTKQDKGTSAPSALKVVINHITLPKSDKDYAADVDGNGKSENQLARILVAFKTFNPTYDTQADVNSSLTEGKVLMLLDLLAKSLGSDPAAKVRFYMGSDPDKNPKNNFSGAAKLAVSATSPTNLVLNGKLVGGKLTAGPGNMQLPLPMGTTPVIVGIRKARITATVSNSGMSKGVVTGAIPWADVEGKMLPSLAKTIDGVWKKPDTKPETKKLLKTLDTDGNGTISAKDLKDSGIIGLLLAADVDLDGDKKPDALSLGVGFTAVKCSFAGK